MNYKNIAGQIQIEFWTIEILQGEWQMAEKVFSWLEADAMGTGRTGETVNVSLSFI